MKEEIDTVPSAEYYRLIARHLTNGAEPRHLPMVYDGEDDNSESHTPSHSLTPDNATTSSSARTPVSIYDDDISVPSDNEQPPLPPRRESVVDSNGRRPSRQELDFADGRVSRFDTRRGSPMPNAPPPVPSRSPQHHPPPPLPPKSPSFGIDTLPPLPPKSSPQRVPPLPPKSPPNDGSHLPPIPPRTPPNLLDNEPPPLPRKHKNRKHSYSDELDTCGSTLELVRQFTRQQQPVVNTYVNTPDIPNQVRRGSRAQSLGQVSYSEVPLLKSLRENDRQIIQSLEHQLAIAISRGEEIEEQLHSAVLMAEERAVIAEEKARIAENQLVIVQGKAKQYRHRLEQAQHKTSTAEVVDNSGDILHLQQELMLAEERALEAEAMVVKVHREKLECEEDSRKSYQLTVQMDAKVKELERLMLKSEAEIHIANERMAEEREDMERVKKREISQLLIPTECIQVATTNERGLHSTVDSTPAVSFIHKSSLRYCGAIATKLTFTDETGNDEWSILESLKPLADIRHPNIIQFIGATLEQLQQRRESDSDDITASGASSSTLECYSVSVLIDHMPTSIQEQLDESCSFSRDLVASIACDILSALVYLTTIKLNPFLKTRLRLSDVLLEECGSGMYRARLTLVEHFVLSASMGNRIMSMTDLSGTTVIKDFGYILAAMLTGRNIDDTTTLSDIADLQGNDVLTLTAVKCIEDYSILSLTDLLTDMTSLQQN